MRKCINDFFSNNFCFLQDRVNHKSMCEEWGKLRKELKRDENKSSSTKHPSTGKKKTSTFTDRRSERERNKSNKTEKREERITRAMVRRNPMSIVGVGVARLETSSYPTHLEEIRSAKDPSALVINETLNNGTEEGQVEEARVNHHRPASESDQHPLMGLSHLPTSTFMEFVRELLNMP